MFLAARSGLELSQMEAAELLGISERTFRRWRDRHREEGLEGLEDRRLAPSPRRAPVAEIERMLGLYRDLYRGFTVKHFHEQLGKTAQLHAGLHGDEAASAPYRAGAAGEEAVSASQEAAAASDGGNDAASEPAPDWIRGCLDACLAAGAPASMTWW